MDEKSLMRQILLSVMEQTPKTPSSRIRVINLSVYDQNLDATALTRAFESLAFNTIAQGAHLHIRRGDTAMKDPAVDPQQVCNSIRVDSFEMEKPAMPVT